MITVPVQDSCPRFHVPVRMRALRDDALVIATIRARVSRGSTSDGATHTHGTDWLALGAITRHISRYR